MERVRMDARRIAGRHFELCQRYLAVSARRRFTPFMLPAASRECKRLSARCRPHYRPCPQLRDEARPV